MKQDGSSDLPSFPPAAQDSYRQLLNGEEALAGHMQGLRTERCARQHDNKKTHFHLGFACEENLSEQVRAE